MDPLPPLLANREAAAVASRRDARGREEETRRSARCACTGARCTRVIRQSAGPILELRFTYEKFSRAIMTPRDQCII